MVQEIVCLLHHHRCKEVIRTIHIEGLRIALLREASEAISQSKLKRCDLLIVDSGHKDSQDLLKNVNNHELRNSTIIIIPQFDQETFRKYIRLGYRYVIDVETFVYLIPTILENLSEFLQNDSHTPKEITKKGLTVSIECGYAIFHNCRIVTSKPALVLLCALLNSNGYCNLKYLRNHLKEINGKELSKSYITVTISRLNREIYKATGMKIIKNRYSFGYYLDI